MHWLGCRKGIGSNMNRRREPARIGRMRATRRKKKGRHPDESGANVWAHQRKREHPREKLQKWKFMVGKGDGGEVRR